MATAAPAIRHLDAAQRARWDRDGWLVVEQVIAESAIVGMKAAFADASNAIIADLVATGRLAQAPDPSLPMERRLAAVDQKLVGSYGRGWRKRVVDPAVWHLHCDSGLVDVLHDLLGPAVYANPIYNVRPKLPHQEKTVVPWHQDAGYYGKNWNHQQIITAWVPVVPVDASNGCMQVVSGSHRRGVREHIVEQGEGGFLVIADDPRADAEATTLPMRPGDVLLMHPLTYHRSLPNSSNGIRWSIDLRFQAEAHLPGSTDLAWPVAVAGQTTMDAATWSAAAAALSW